MKRTIVLGLSLFLLYSCNNQQTIGDKDTIQVKTPEKDKTDTTGTVKIPKLESKLRLDSRIGLYVSNDGEKAGYYSTLKISKNVLREWMVEIKVKETSTKVTICDFSGKGEFLDGDLFVPLDYIKPDIKGQLQIRFIDLHAFVYTEDHADVGETIKFCNGTGSIVGTFDKTDI